MSTEKTQLLDEAFNFLIMAYDKRARPTELLLDVLNRLKLKVIFIDEVQIGELELKSVDNALSNTPAILVLISEEVVGNDKFDEFFCMAIEKYCKSHKTARTIPVYVPNKSSISYFNKLPSYITNKVGISMDPEHLEEFAKNLQSKILSAKWYRTALSNLSRNVECKEKKNAAPSPNYVTTQQRNANVCAVPGDCANQAISSMIAECDLNSRSGEVSHSQEIGISTPEEVQSENVLKHWTDYTYPASKGPIFHTENTQWKETNTNRALENVRDKLSAEDKTNVPTHPVAGPRDSGIQKVSSMIAECSLGEKSFTISSQDGIDAAPIAGSTNNSAETMMKQINSGIAQEIRENAPHTYSSNLPLDCSSSSSDVGEHTGEESVGQVDTCTTQKIRKSTLNNDSDCHQWSLHANDNTVILTGETEVQETHHSISKMKACLYRNGMHTEYDNSHFYLPPMTQVNNTTLQVPDNSRGHASKQPTETECSFQSTF